MNAKQFVEEIKKITPLKEQLKNETDFFVGYYLQCLSVITKEKQSSVTEKNAVIDLICNFDVSNLLIQVFSFSNQDDVWDNDNFVYFGWREAFLLGISKQTGEIVELDWGSPEHIVSYVAKNQELFLDTLIELEKLNQKRMFGLIDNTERKQILQKFGKYAGGDKYNNSYKDL
jgi:hypothetical protein